MVINSVDLPEPDGPTSPTVSPRAMDRLTPRKICTRAAPEPRLKSTPRNSTAGAPATAGAKSISAASRESLGAVMKLSWGQATYGMFRAAVQSFALVAPLLAALGAAE